ncbi:hypothetical protein [Phyllobacterium brassicacearum]|uniref:hypothetical protein n=1 Tax=Phyllobacterium brassicacearum TaxID=314235 RepID=UPI00105E4E97|nr:hypothetical protein [Phyllobacterium brassicacearum]
MASKASPQLRFGQAMMRNQKSAVEIVISAGYWARGAIAPPAVVIDEKVDARGMATQATHFALL